MRAFLAPLFGSCILAAGVSHAQELIHAIDGTDAWMQFGFAVDGTGDLNGDGKGDFVVGEPGGIFGLPGRATVFSGGNAAVLHVVSQGLSVDFLGEAVAGIGDVDTDGVPDFAVGAPSGTAQNGVVWILSGLDGSAIHTLLGHKYTFGDTLAATGDFDGDGAGDVLIRSVSSGTGAIELRSGATGGVLQIFLSTTSNTSFGQALASAGDTNGDGFLDVVVGDLIENGVGSAAVYSGSSAQVLYKLWGDAQGDLFGNAVDGLGDVNGDGYDDLLIGAPENDTNGITSGLVRVHSGVNGAELYRIAGADQSIGLGQAVARAGDLDLDGIPDFIAGAPVDKTLPGGWGTVRAFSGADGSQIFAVTGPPIIQCFGCSLAASDINGDEYADLIVGSYADDTSGTDSGYVRVFSGRCGAMLPYGSGCPGAFGFVPQVSGDPPCGALPGYAVNISITGGYGGAAAVLLLGAGESALPLGYGCLLNVWPVLPVQIPLQLGGVGAGNGNVTFFATIPPSTPVATVTLQGFVVDGASPLGYSATNGLRVSIQ